jgi:hypothetical protein
MMAFGAVGLAKALFYPVSLALPELQQIVLGLKEPADLDVVDFAAEQGGDATRELAVPFVANMTDIEVSKAQIRFKVRPKDLDIDGFSVKQGPGGKGIYLALDSPARLKKIELQYTDPVGVLNLHVVVRNAENKDSVFTPGPPVFADPEFAAPGPMFDKVLAGMQVQNLGGNRKLLKLPGLMGSAFLIQLATGTSASELTPIAFNPTVNRVTVEAVPQNLSILLPGPEEVALFSHPGDLLPDVGEQEVNFTPLAQKQLRSQLKSLSSAVTLPMTLKFHSDRAGQIGITGRDLTARYLSKPLGSEPVKLRLGGSQVPLSLLAPAGIRPDEISMNLTVKHLGRELNAGSPEPPASQPASGLRVNLGHSAGMAIPFQGSTTPLPLVSARVYLGAMEDSEAVLELHADAAGAPGQMLSKPIVKQIAKGFRDWLEFEPPAPLQVEPGPAPIWVVVRANKGELLWFAGSAGTPPQISVDRGHSWAGAEDHLAPGAAPLLAQLFHATEQPIQAPEIRLQYGDNTIATNLLVNPSSGAPGEFAVRGASFPAALAEILATSKNGQGPARTMLHLFSRSVLDLTIDNLILYYSPFQPVVGGV